MTVDEILAVINMMGLVIYVFDGLWCRDSPHDSSRKTLVSSLSGLVCFGLIQYFSRHPLQ